MARSTSLAQAMTTRPRLSVQEWHCPQWAGPSHINQENEIQACSYANLLGHFFQLRVPLPKWYYFVSRLHKTSHHNRRNYPLQWHEKSNPGNEIGRRRDRMCISGRGSIPESPSGKAVTWYLRNNKRRFLRTGPITYIYDLRTRNSLGGFRNSKTMWLK